MSTETTVRPKPMSLYDHADDYFALRNLMDEAMSDEEGNARPLDDDTKLALMELADQWKADFQAKAERVCRFRLEMQNHVEACKAESRRLAERAKMFEGRVFALNYLIQTVMERLGLRKMDAGSFGLSIAKNPPALIVDDAEKVPAVFFDVIPEHLSINNARIKDALKDGADVPGARLVQGESLRVK